MKALKYILSGIAIITLLFVILKILNLDID